MNDRDGAGGVVCNRDTRPVRAAGSGLRVGRPRAHWQERQRDAGRCPHPPLKRPYRSTNPFRGTGVHNQICVTPGEPNDRFCNRLSELIVAPPDHLRNLGKLYAFSGTAIAPGARRRANPHFHRTIKMSETPTAVQPEPTAVPTNSGGLQQTSEHAVASLRASFETDLSGIIDRLMTQAVAEADAAVERVRAAGQLALEAAQASLAEQTRRNDELTESLLQSEIQVEQLRESLQAECEQTKAARNAYEAEDAARARAEASNVEADAIHQKTVAAYESRLQAAHSQLDGIRTELEAVKRQLEAEVSERARLIGALRTVQQTCAIVESATRQDTAPDTQDEPRATSRGDLAPANDVTADAAHTGDDRQPASTTAAADRHLKLVASSETVTVAGSPRLLEYFKELFEQIDAMYQVDQQTHTSVDVVGRLAANLRYARERFVQRANTEGVDGGTLFEQLLSVKLDEVSVTGLERHLAIAAYELIHPVDTRMAAEAS
jgi:hypothetical protein